MTRLSDDDLLRRMHMPTLFHSDVIFLKQRYTWSEPECIPWKNESVKDQRVDVLALRMSKKKEWRKMEVFPTPTDVRRQAREKSGLLDRLFNRSRRGSILTECMYQMQSQFPLRSLSSMLSEMGLSRVIICSFVLKLSVCWTDIMEGHRWRTVNGRTEFLRVRVQRIRSRA